jgi:hypothetical protein
MERLPPLEVPLPAAKSKGRAVAPKRPAHHPLVTAWRGFLEEAAATEGGYMAPQEERPRRVRREADDPRRGGSARRDPYRARDAELTENVRVRRAGVDRYVRISDLPPTRRYAPQAPGEADETRDMPTGGFVLRAYSPRHDALRQHEWTESQKGEFVTMAAAIANAFEEARARHCEAVEDAEQRRHEQEAREQIERRRRQARERAEARQRARQAAKEVLRSIVKGWSDAFALEAFFTELSRRALTLAGDERPTSKRVLRRRAI